jgi:hypothetical protein
MHGLKGIFISLLVVSPIAVSFSVSSMNSAKAQAASQTLAQCIKELNEAYPYRVESDVFRKHTQVCLKNLATQTPTESLGQCVAGMNQIYPYRVESDVAAIHTEACNNLLTAQRSNSNRQVQSNPPPPYPYPPYPYPPYPQQSVGDPQAIADCVKKLLYERKPVCTRDGYCARLGSPEENANNNFGGWQWQTVRTSMSESAAAQACQGAR